MSIYIGTNGIMLNKLVCKKCIGKLWTDDDETRWKFGHIICHWEWEENEERKNAQIQIYGMTRTMVPPFGIRIKSLPPSKCPYILEHVVSL